MLVATRSFITRYCGSETRIIAGVSRVVEDHEIARRNAGSFKPADLYPGPAHERTRLSPPASVQLRASADDLPTRPRGREPWRLMEGSRECRISAAPSCDRVRLCPLARAELLATIAETTAQDGLEVGGLLLGAISSGLVEVVRAAGPGPSAVRRIGTFRPDAEHDLAFATRVREQTGGTIGPIGYWHTHPARSCMGAPSSSDLTAFAAWRSRSGAERFCALISVETRYGWEFEGWVVRSRGFGPDICEAAALS